MSGEALGREIHLDVAVDPSLGGDAGVPYGEPLLAFATAVCERSAELASARRSVGDTVGEHGLREAAATVAIFNGLVRVADGTGIQLDASLLAASAGTRADLGIDAFAGAANSKDAAVGSAHPASIQELFA